ncbi:MAG: chromosome segregation protein SMC [Chloroflexi bacterium RBG_16_57_11]|nr:MAG: chromosome segregation protein SMC [Chloroflexi bacterium RBG_16_57_11]
MPRQLKSLELHGYKTFANRTLFEFAEKVTAIVGPNGSGKSNIADSLRWVLGEQSYGLLRGKKTEDMIFSGSENRPRSGLASATITFDNSDGWLPIDYSEVAIARRAHRDGSNEYLVNGQRVRLKDVGELLAQSGLAERTYTVIGQGLVDAALSLKADERRRLFEEAAGIGLHRARREEALRRLEATRRNLERVQDILAELKPRLSSLERQARRAQEYEQLRADLQILLHEWYGYYWHTAQFELSEARKAVQSQETRLEKVRNEQNGVEQSLAALRQQLGLARAGLNAYHKELSGLHGQREVISRQLAVSEERLRLLHQQQAGVHSERERLEEELSSQRDLLVGSIQDVDQLRIELEEASDQLNKVQLDLTARQQERLLVEKSVQDVRQQLSSLSIRQGQLQARLVEIQAQAERTHKELEKAIQGQAKTEQARQTAYASRQAALAATQKAESAYKDAAEAELNGQKQLEAVEMERKQALEERSNLAAELARLKAQQDVLDQAENTLTGYAEGARILLQATRQQRLSGARGALSSYLETPAELERAITAALGEFLEAIVLENEPDSALDLLRESTGRGVLLPIPLLGDKRTKRLVLHVNEEVLGIASDLVNAQQPEVRQALDLLLGQVIVVRDRPAARRALSGQPGNVRAVTLNGEVFYASGPVTGGGGGGEGAAVQQTLLGRNRQRKELKAVQSRRQSEQAALDERLQVIEADVLAHQSEADRLAQAQEASRLELYKASQAVDQAVLTLEAAERQAAWAQEQRLRLEDDLEHGQTEITNHLLDLKEIDRLLEETRSNLRQEVARLEELDLDELHAEQAHWNTRLAVAERALSDAQNRQQERQTSVNHGEHNLAALERRLGELVAELAAVQVQRTDLLRDEAQIGEVIRELSAKIEPAETELESLEAESDERQKAEAVTRQNYSLAEHTHTQMRIALARRQEALQSLQRRVEEDFGLVAFEYEEQVSGPTPLPLAGMVEQLPIVKKLSPDIEESIKRQRAQLRRMGAINPEAQAEYHEVKQRYEFMVAQVADLEKAEKDTHAVIAELDSLMQHEFQRTFEAVAAEFRQIFIRLFGGGSARLVLTDPDDMTETGIDIEARLPGRRTQGLALLSGGERSLTATALVFALLKVAPTPFCVLDEVDAMLDEVNVGRFRDLLRELSEKTQFVIITHNRNTVQAADVIYGVTMGRDSSSQVLSLKLDQVEDIAE